MKLIDSLIKQFGYNTSFMLSEIEKEDYSKQQIIKEVTKLCEAKKVIRFERGMYYIPRKTKFGTSFFNQNKVIEKNIFLTVIWFMGIIRGDIFKNF